MMGVSIRAYQEEDEAAIIRIWQECSLVRPQNDPCQDIQRKLLIHRELFLVAEVDGEIAGTVIAGYEGHRGWINYLAVSADYRRRGIGSMLMEEAERALRSQGCPKINLQVRASNQEVLHFYHQIGFSTDDVVSLGKRLIQDHS